MGKPKKQKSKRQLEGEEIGAQNFAEEKERISNLEAEPHNQRHGIRSRYTQALYDDPDTEEGRILNQIMSEIIEGLCVKRLSGEQKVRLAMIRSKIIVVLQISKYLDGLSDIIEDGQLVPILRRDLIRYHNGLCRDLEGLREATIW